MFYVYVNIKLCEPATYPRDSVKKIGLIFRMNKGHLCEDVFVNKYGKCCLWVYLTSSISAFCKSSTVICLRIFNLQSKLLRFCKKNLYFKIQAVKRFNLYKLEQRLMSLPIEFSSPVKRDSKAEQIVCSLADINPSGGVRFDNLFVGRSVRGFVKNSGPFNHFFTSLELARMPRKARSAGFKFDGTWRQQSSSVFCSMIAKRLATNTGKRLVLFFMQ